MNVFTSLFSTSGFAILIAVVFGIMLFVSGADLYLTWRGQHTIGEYVNAAVDTRKWVALLIAAVFGAMVAHFFIYITNG